MGAPNASIRVIIGMSIIKEGFDCSYANLTIDRKSFVPGDTITVTVDVKNTGEMAGKETVMLFTNDLVASITPDVRRLRAFRKINLQPGEQKTVTLKVAANDLAFVNPEGKWILEEGDFKFQVGDLVDKVTCAQTKIWQTPNR
ncbi:MAG: fibronectin type III-like domain-contianing protein [Dysgonamonadaceae bacterium]